MTVYRSANVDLAIAEARLVLASHRPDASGQRCAACGMAAPCRHTRVADGLLTAMGLTAARPEAPGLLTHGWRLALGADERRATAVAGVR